MDEKYIFSEKDRMPTSTNYTIFMPTDCMALPIT